MGSKIDISGKSVDVMEISPSVIVENVKPSTLAKEELSRLAKEELGNCVSNREDDEFQLDGFLGDKPDCQNFHEDDVFHIEDFQGVCDNGVDIRGNNGELEVDIVGNVMLDEGEGEERTVDGESQDATECSSSFGCTDSGSGNAEMSGDMEVESQVRDDNAMLMEFDDCSDLFRTRKKKLTDEWRKYVRPLMWRCKWVELHIKELQSQASKYARELAECDKRKQCELDKVSTEDHAMKSAPYIYQNRTVKLMKRKKRKRVEETVDLASYTTCHSLFSHFVNKKTAADTAHVDDDVCHSGSGKTHFEDVGFGADELPLLQCKDSDAFESILRKIEEAQIHVRQMKMRMDKVVRENAEKIASFAQRNLLTNGDPNSVRPHVNDEPSSLGYMPTTSQCSSQKLVIPETTISIVEEVRPPHVIKPIDDPQIAGNCVKIENEIIISNPSVKEEFISTDDEKLDIVPHVPDPFLVGKMKMPQEQPTAKVQSLSSKMTFPNYKRKRGRRKARTSRWSKRSSG